MVPGVWAPSLHHSIMRLRLRAQSGADRSGVRAHTTTGTPGSAAQKRLTGSTTAGWLEMCEMTPAAKAPAPPCAAIASSTAAMTASSER